jgi:hypothetical protein
VPLGGRSLGGAFYWHPVESASKIAFNTSRVNTQPGLPIKRGRYGTMTHNYSRHRTMPLFAALDVLEAKIIGQCIPCCRHQEFIRFLKRDQPRYPGRAREPHLLRRQIVPHKHPKLLPGWNRIPDSVSTLFRSRRSGSRLEGFFAKLTRQPLKRGVFKGILELQVAINRYLVETDNNTKPFT